MIEIYKDIQPIVYKTIKNQLEKEKLSHAYLIESNGYSATFDFAVSLAKTFLNKNEKSNDILELKIINPEGMWIKKEQIDELQFIFSEKAVMGNKKVYIINGVEKMKEATSNSLLKFLEEPEEGIIAILITENIYQIPITILSRCQVLSLIKNSDIKGNDTKTLISKYLYTKAEDIENFIDNENSEIYINKVIDFIYNFEKNNINAIIYTKKLWHSTFIDREKTKIAFEILLLFYKDVLNLKLNRDIEYFIDDIEDIKNIEQQNTLQTLVNKISKINELKEKIKFNINLGLLLDKLIIEMDRCSNND